jgi:hypothetical protein
VSGSVGPLRVPNVGPGIVEWSAEFEGNVNYAVQVQAIDAVRIHADVVRVRRQVDDEASIPSRFMPDKLERASVLMRPQHKLPPDMLKTQGSPPQAPEPSNDTILMGLFKEHMQLPHKPPHIAGW